MQCINQAIQVSRSENDCKPLQHGTGPRRRADSVLLTYPQPWSFTEWAGWTGAVCAAVRIPAPSGLPRYNPVHRPFQTFAVVRMRNPLQDQLLKAGLVKKSKVAQVVREQTKQRHGKEPAAPAPEHVDAQRLQAERAERDRMLAAERNAQMRTSELIAQVRQVVETHKIRPEGEIPYRFTDADRIRSVLVNDAARAQLAVGALVIVRHGEGYELLPRAAAEKVRARDAAMIVLDHAHGEASRAVGGDDDHYSRFKVPDDLIW